MIRVNSIDGGTYIVCKTENGQVSVHKLLWQPLSDVATPKPAQDGPRAEVGGIYIYPVPTLIGDDVRLIGQHVYVSPQGFNWLRNAQSVNDLPMVFKQRIGDAVTNARATQFTVDDSVTKFLQQLGKGNQP